MIAFRSNRGGSQQIYVMEPDGSDQTQVTSGFDFADFASWSPDGRKIAFVAKGGPTSGKQIYVINADGSGQTQLTNEHSISGARPAWSPDGKQVAFTKDITDMATYIYVMNADGSGEHRLNTTWLGTQNQPDWSPDGTRIVFQGLAPDPDREFGLFVIDAGGSDVTRLTRGRHTSPVWSPDGQKIAFIRPGPGGFGTDICVMNADGSDATIVPAPADQGARSEPDWSPDGTKFAFHMSATNNIDIYAMNADGSGVTKLTSAQGSNVRPNWARSVPKRGRRVREAVDARGLSSSPRIAPGGGSIPGRRPR